MRAGIRGPHLCLGSPGLNRASIDLIEQPRPALPDSTIHMLASITNEMNPSRDQTLAVIKQANRRGTSGIRGKTPVSWVSRRASLLAAAVVRTFQPLFNRARNRVSRRPGDTAVCACLVP